MNQFSKICALVIALLVLCASARYGVAQTNPATTRAPKSYAVVIGINKYPKLPGGQQLMFADKDATAFAEAMKKVCGDNVRTFINQEATLAAIKEAVGNWLARSTLEGDTVYLFFSGHGIVEAEYGEAYLLAYDSDAKQPFASALSLRELNHAIGSRVRAGKLLVIADAVRQDFFEPDSGGVATSTMFSRAFDKLADARPGVATLLANAAGEYSREGQRWNGHSVFTKYLLDALAGDGDANHDGAINADELYNFVASRVAGDTSNKQHPSRSGNLIAEIIVARTSSTIVAAKPIEPVKNTAPPVVAKAEAKESNKSAPPASVAKAEAAKSEPVNKPASPVVTAEKVTPAATPTVKQPEPTKPRQLIAEATKPTAQPAAEISKPTNPPTTEASKAPVQPTAEASKPKPVESKPTPKPVEATAPTKSEAQPAPKTEANRAAKPAPPKPALPTPPTVKTRQPLTNEAKTSPPTTAALATNLSTPPAPVKPTPQPPAIVPLSEAAPQPPPTAAASSLPVTELASAPSPLPSQFEMAIAAGRIIEPRGNNAWELYQQMNGQAATIADAVRLKPQLIDALIRVGKETVSGDVRGDNISDRVDDFKRAGQLFARGKSLAPENKELPLLEKLSAAEALLALQFYDEAERALSQMPQSAAAENAFGIAYAGKLETFKAERAYKNAIEMEPNWYAPHYNLALLYRSQKNDGALAAFEKAAALNEKNYAVWLALGDEYFSQNRWQQAAESYRKAVALKPNDDNLHTKLGHALYSQGLRDEANREYQKAKELRGRQ